MMKLYVFNSFANYVIIIIPVTYIVTFIAEQVEQVGNLCALETLVIKQSALAGTNRSPGYRLTLGTHFVFLILVFFYLWFQHFFVHAEQYFRIVFLSFSKVFLESCFLYLESVQNIMTVVGRV